MLSTRLSHLPAPAALPARAKLFPDAGLAVYRDGAGQYLLITNGKVGTNGFGNHKHNDLLSFEYHHDGVALVVDPGSYVYTSDFDARNRFRSTAYHNTLQLDGREQNDLKPEWIFRLFETSHAEHIAILKAIEARDADTAAALVDDHLMTVEHQLTERPRAPHIPPLIARRQS
mgnify:CR=1 FL=1